MRLNRLGLAGLSVIASTAAVFAHHSFSMFDAQASKTVEGTIKEFQWTNPHSWILMMVSNKDGQLDQWAIEMGGPIGLARQGWTPKTLKPGMQVKTVIHPLRDGSNGGQFMAITFPDGSTLGDVNAPASANAGGGP